MEMPQHVSNGSAERAHFAHLTASLAQKRRGFTIAYLLCLTQELLERGLSVEVEKPIAVSYGGVAAACAFRVDLMVSEQVIVEVKCVEVLAAIHRAQMITYLKLTGCPVGLLINFNVQVLKNGVKRIVNNLRDGEGKLV